MNTPIRVAQVIGMAINGGVEQVVWNYYQHIDKTKIQFDFFVESESKIIKKEKIEALGGKIVVIPSYKNPFKYMRTLKKLFKEGNYDIVHSNMNTLSVFALRAAKKAGIKVRIAHSHSTSNPDEHLRNILKNMLRPFSKRYATHYFACSELAGRYLFGNKTYDKGEVTIINNAIDLEKFRFNQEVRDSLRKELGIDKNYIVGHIGRFSQQKNHTFLIDIFKNLLDKRPDAKLLLLGNGPLYEEILEKVNSLGIQDNVVFAGVQENPEKYYNAMDCFTLPSLYEGLPVVGIEAQVNGLKCCFSSEVTKEVGILDTTEFIDLTDNSTIWAEKIAKAGTSENRAAAYEKFIDSEYDIVAQSERLDEIYQHLKNSGGGYLIYSTLPSEIKAINSKFVIGHVGRFMKQKNHKFLIDVFDEVQKIKTNAVLLLLGDGELMGEVKNYVNELGLTDKVIFAGAHRHTEKYYNAMDCFLFPSLYEGLGMVLVEAQANGLPCIASDKVPEEARITDNLQFISLNRTAKEWAAELLDNYKIADRAGHKEIVDFKYDIAIQAERLENIYINLIS